MIVDTSALIAILKVETDALEFVQAIAARRDGIRLSAGSLIETTTVVIRHKVREGLSRLDALLDRIECEIVPVDSIQARVAREAYLQFGRGSGHAAKLNFGDCFAYALAKTTGEPLLFKGDDFSRTDIESA